MRSLLVTELVVEIRVSTHPGKSSQRDYGAKHNTKDLKDSTRDTVRTEKKRNYVGRVHDRSETKGLDKETLCWVSYGCHLWCTAILGPITASLLLPPPLTVHSLQDRGCHLRHRIKRNTATDAMNCSSSPHERRPGLDRLKSLATMSPSSSSAWIKCEPVLLGRRSCSLSFVSPLHLAHRQHALQHAC